MLWHLPIIFLALQIISFAHSHCYDPSPAFPPPRYSRLSSHQSREIEHAFASIGARASQIARKFPSSSFSIEVTSSDSTLWEHHHTAPIQRNASHPSADNGRINTQAPLT